MQEMEQKSQRAQLSPSCSAGSGGSQQNFQDPIGDLLSLDHEYTMFKLTPATALHIVAI